ncbi:acetoacetate--CoA ligase [Amycolatopsis rhabdoformis]|uniref:Acetoacetate--CoA ligase n=1 Tax=Amycolatopsis rhabdoformis TaxID=1448059 RepID=A0ABZ1IDB3_9PSEU|nr:acetoacetate--CoA ligase [Amycolatopsis rhabdoformis]WSE32460.1 acetoacetate--CoA ligase [Amycolatopsis rhabdoformis]
MPNADPDLIWSVDETRVGPTRMADFTAFAAKRHGVPLADYTALQRWSVADPDAFWATVWEWFDVRASTPYERVRSGPRMPGTEWFAGATLNYVDQVLRHTDAPGPAVVEILESGARREIGRPELARQVGAFARTLRGLGVRPGDRVAGYLSNSAPALVAFLGSAAVGAVWAGCGPDLGGETALARLAQLEPVVLVGTGRYHFAGKAHDREADLARLVAGLPSLRAVVVVDDLGEPRSELPADTGPRVVRFEDTISGDGALVTEQVPAGHPLWVLFSSGTTGIPKGIVHGHAGVLVSHLVALGLHSDLRPGDRYFWYTGTNWMLWNMVASVLLVGATPVLYAGSPTYPDADRLWEIVASERVRYFGTSPGHLRLSADAGLTPGRTHELSALRTIGVTGSPLSANLARWTADVTGPDVQVVSSSGGTDVVGAFLSAARSLPVRAGEMPAAALGVALDSFDSAGRPVRDEVGELVVTAPMPAMPLYLWNDPDGSRLREAYFATYPGVWRHGDWLTLTSRGTAIIHGRSDSTLNRHGVRFGSADIYDVVEALPEISEALVIGAEMPDGSYWMPLFVVLTEGILDEPLRERIRTALRTKASPRHVPDEIRQVPAVPHTRTGKKVEVPVKRILQGARIDAVVSRGAVDDPALLDFYEQLREDRLGAAR